MATVQGQAQPTNHSDPAIKRRLIHQQLVLLLHAYKCAENAKILDGHVECTLSHCQTMKDVLTHLNTCRLNSECKQQHCWSSRQIIQHWKNCIDANCSVCSPLKSFASNRDKGSPDSPQDLLECLSAQLQDIHLQPEEGQDALENIPLNAQYIEQQAKEWRNTVTPDLRERLVNKFVVAMCPLATDPAVMEDRRMNNLISYAKKVEGDLYEMASSRSEYYHLLAEKIYKIQKELEEKRQMRMEAGQSAQ